jgi:membrane-associated protease RseP (regulator of RpoE activity)
VLLGEPPRSAGDLHFRLFGIPVRVHPYFWLVAVMLGLGPDSQLSDILIWVVAVVISILIHELGHALLMRAYGLWPWITLTGFGGLASADPAGAQRIGTAGNVLISFAGPAAQFVLVAGLAAALKALGYSITLDTSGIVPLVYPGEPVASWGVSMLLIYLMTASVSWAVLNLIPVYPLDGGQIARDLFLAASPRNGITRSLILSIVAAVAVAVVALSNGSKVLALMAGLLAYSNYAALQAYRNQRGW